MAVQFTIAWNAIISFRYFRIVSTLPHFYSLCRDADPSPSKRKNVNSTVDPYNPILKNHLVHALDDPIAGIPLLTHSGRATRICVGRLTTTGSDNGLSPGRRQAIIWTNVGILSVESLGTNISEIWIKILAFSFKKMHLKMSSGKWRPSCLSLNVLKIFRIEWDTPYQFTIEFRHARSRIRQK